MKIKLLAFALFVAAISVPTLGQIGDINGYVKDSDGNPIKDAQVRIEGMTTKRNYKLKTDKNGFFRHAGVSVQNIYRVIAEKEGYQGDFIQGIKATYGGRGDPIQLTLQKGQARKLAFEMTDEERKRLQEQAAKADQIKEQNAAVRGAFEAGMAAFDGGDYEAAVDSFLEATEADQGQPAIWGNLARAYEKLDRYDDGIDAYQKAIALAPEAAMYQNLGNLYAAKGDTDKAQEVYNQAAEMAALADPSAAALTYYNMGVTFINTGENDKAAEALSKAVELDPNHAESHYQLGITLLGTGDMAGAVKHLKRYVELEPAGANAETAKALIESLEG